MPTPNSNIGYHDLICAVILSGLQARDRRFFESDWAGDLMEYVGLSDMPPVAYYELYLEREVKLHAEKSDRRSASQRNTAETRE